MKSLQPGNPIANIDGGGRSAEGRGRCPRHGVRAGRLPAVAVPSLGHGRVAGPGRGRPRPDGVRNDAGGGGAVDVPHGRPDGPRERGRVAAAVRERPLDGLPGPAFRGGRKPHGGMLRRASGGSP